MVKITANNMIEVQVKDKSKIKLNEEQQQAIDEIDKLKTEDNSDALEQMKDEVY
jgi:hypothetical protein